MLHVDVQLTPGGELVTLPLPLTLTDSASASAKVAVTDSAAAIVTVQLPLPKQAPPQLLKTQPLAGVGVKATCDPPVKVWLHVDGQLIQAGLLATVPLPVTLTVKLALPPPAETQFVTRL